MKRIPLSARALPNYSKGEEIMNTVTHIVGGGIGIFTVIGCLIKGIRADSTIGIVCGIIYGLSMILLYTVSSVYHGLKPSFAKKVLQVLDHCAIYLLIAGTYTPISLLALAPKYPALGYGMTIFQWTLAIFSVILTAIDLKKYNIFSLGCYIATGWAILPFISQAVVVLTTPGFLFLLSGGIAYTLGAVLYVIGSRQKWFHSIFHIFCILGTLLQLISIYCYIY